MHWPVLIVLTALVPCLCAVVRFDETVRPALLRDFPWLQQSWTASPYFVFWQAHIWFAVSVMLAAHLLHFDLWKVAVLGLNAAAVKEQIYDFTWEEPVQTDDDTWKDFAGYAIGVAIGLVTCPALDYLARVL